jgi:hypothetical protein
VYLNNLELKAFSGVVDALRAAGDLTEERSALLGELARHLNISHTRHKTEIRRALNTELLVTLAARYFNPLAGVRTYSTG